MATGLSWTDADFAAFERLNQPTEIRLRGPHGPAIRVDPRGYEALAHADDRNPLAEEAVRAFRENVRQGAQSAERGVYLDPLEYARRANEVLALQDRILAAVIVDPPYCPKTQYQHGKPLLHHLYFDAFTPDERRRIADLFYSGADALKSFRPGPGQDEPLAGDGGELSPAPAPVPAGEPAVADVGPVVVQRGGDALEQPTAGVGAGAGAGRAVDAPGPFVPGPA